MICWRHANNTQRQEQGEESYCPDYYVVENTVDLRSFLIPNPSKIRQVVTPQT